MGTERRGTHKGREADDGKAPKGEILTSQRKDPAKKGCNTTGSDVKGRKAVTGGQVSPGHVSINAATVGAAAKTRRGCTVLDYPSQETQRGAYSLLTKTKGTMKDFFEKLLTDDETRQKFTTKEMVVYGIVVPLVLVLIMGLAGWLETSCA